jgi:hypothetical protein
MSLVFLEEKGHRVGFGGLGVTGDSSESEFSGFVPLPFCLRDRPFECPASKYGLGGLRERRELAGTLMRWTKWSWFALTGGLVVAVLVWILFAPEIRALHR